MFLSFHHGMIPSCLGETINLALENRPESFSLGRNLSVERVREIGAIAAKNGFRFDRLYSFGLALEASQLAEYHKAVTRRTGLGRASRGSRRAASRRTAMAIMRTATANGSRAKKSTTASDQIPTPQELSGRAAELYERYINPVLLAIGGQQWLHQDIYSRAGQSSCGTRPAINTSTSSPASAPPTWDTIIRGSSRS